MAVRQPIKNAASALRGKSATKTHVGDGLEAILQSNPQLRRLVIGEVTRFPELARVLYERGPARAMKMLANVFADLASRGLLAIDDPATAAEHFNWLIMSAPLNQAMLLGDDAIPSQAELRRNAEAGVRVFLAAYGMR